MRKLPLLAVALLLAWPAVTARAATPSCGPMKSHQIASAVDQVLAQMRELLPDGAEVNAGLIEVSSCERLPARFHDIDVSASLGRRVGRQIRVALRLLDKTGRRVGQAWLKIEIDVRVPTVVTTRRINIGDMLGESDVELVMRPPERSGHDACTRIDQVVGLAARRSVGTGQALSDQVLDRPLLVRRGELVRAAVLRGPLRVVRQGVAQEEGRLGDRIRLKTQDGTRDFTGRVTRAGNVVVAL